MTEPTFKNLLAPLSVDEFFRDSYERRPLHIPGNADKARAVFSWDELNALLDMTTLWSERSMLIVRDGKSIDPRNFCVPGALRDGGPTLRPVPERVRGFLEQGATMVLNLMERLSPGVASVAESIEMVTGGQTVCNIYCSWNRQQAFASHFDNTDVFVLQIDGSKHWRIYQGRFDNPMDNSPYTFDAFPAAYHEKAKGAVLAEIDMAPGDVLYIPCGQYHDANATSDSSLHLSFGVNRTTGIDVAEVMLRSLPEVSEFRAPLPHFDDTEAHARHLKGLAERISALLGASATAEQVRAFQRECAYRDTAPRLELPARGAVRRFRVRPRYAHVEESTAQARLRTPEGDQALDAEQARLAAWILDRDHFTDRRLFAVFPDVDRGLIHAALERLQAAGIIQGL